VQAIPGRGILGYLKTKRTPVFNQKSMVLSDGDRRKSRGSGDVRQSRWGAAINIMVEPLFMIAISDGGVITGLLLKEGPGPDSGHNSPKTGHNSFFFDCSPT
jgi:hypothetical protein